MDRRQVLKAGAAIAALGPVGALAQLQGNAFLISGFPAGGMGDFVARPLAEKMRGKYAANVLIEAKPGAGGRIAVEYVKRAAPDGLTILQIPSFRAARNPRTWGTRAGALGSCHESNCQEG